MNKQNLIIYDFIELFSILNEIKNGLNFNLLNVSKKEFDDLKLDHLNSFLIITKIKVPNLENQIVLSNYPLKISKIIETININFLKNKFVQQSEIDLGLYKLNLNSRKVYNDFVDKKKQSENERLCKIRKVFDQFNLISGLHTFLSKEHEIYKNILPPLSLLDEKDEKKLLEDLKKLDFN